MKCCNLLLCQQYFVLDMNNVCVIHKFNVLYAHTTLVRRL